MLIIAYLGPQKTNTHLAAIRHFGKRNKFVHEPTVEDVFRLVERRQADYGIVPIENSLGGAVTHTLDRYIDFKDSPVKIHGEIDQPINHHLIFRPTTRLHKIRVVYSHPQAFEQCHRWLEETLPNVSRSETDSTAAAVQHLLHKRIGNWSTLWDLKERAAIGPKELVRENKLRSIAIPNERENRTRFLILGLDEAPRGHQHKTSILIGLKDTPGSLHDALLPFKKYQINLTKIESRPSKQKAWEYLFFIDFEGHTSDAKVQSALEELRSSTSLLHILGSYPFAHD